MTRLTIDAGGRRKMHGGLAGCTATVMTHITRRRIRQLKVIHEKRSPGFAGVATITTIGAQHVRDRFTRRSHTVMTARAILDRCGSMREHRIRPVGCGMTGVALSRRYDVRRAFALGKRAIVTTAANADDIAVVYLLRRCESACTGVTMLTHVAAGDVCVTFAGESGTGVTAGTVACYACVIKFNGVPTLCAAMTRIAVQTCAHVLRRHAVGDDPVVALTAFSNHLSVIDKRNRCPRKATAMAGFAASGGKNMIFAFAG